MSMLRALELNGNAGQALVDTQLQKAVSDAGELKELKDAANQDEKVWKVACAFEEVFVNMMLKEMRKNTMSSGLLGDGNDARIYREMFDAEIAGTMAESRRFGLSQTIHDYLASDSLKQNVKKIEELTRNQKASQAFEQDSNAAKRSLDAVM